MPRRPGRPLGGLRIPRALEARRLWSGLRSLRWRLTLSFALLLLLLLSALGSYEYISLRRDLVATRVSSLGNDLTAAQAAFAREVPPGAPSRRVCPAAAGADATRSMDQLFATTLLRTSGRGAVVVLYNRGLVAVITAPPSPNPPRLDPAGLDAALHGRTSPSQEVDTTTGTQLVVGFPLQNSARAAPCGVVQLAVSMQPIDDVLAGTARQLMLGGAITLLLALLIGRVLTGGALRPLHRLTVTAGQLAAGNLRTRSGLAPRHDEVGLLARSVDNMADRIEESFATVSEQEQRTRRFIADAAHELATPVTGIKGHLDVLNRGAGRDPATLSAILASMQRDADRMRLLVLDLQTLARLDAQPAEVPAVIDVNAHLGRLLDEGLPEGMPAEVIRSFAPGPVTARCDPAAFSTVVRNLLANACKYAPGARQTWSTGTDGATCVIVVHDEGPGIAAADLPHIFERFFRGEKTRAREQGGSGLGLSIVEGLVRAQGGAVSLESEEHCGVTVTVRLPAAPAGTTPDGGPLGD